jgi:hypothetical protein
MDLNDDAFEPLRKVYHEYLNERFQNDPAEKRHRIARFEGGQPDLEDEAKIKAGQDAYLQSVRAGSSEETATNEASTALFKKHYGERFMETQVDQKLYKDNPNYSERKDKEMDETVQKKLEERQDQAANPSNTNQNDQQNTNPRKR